MATAQVNGSALTSTPYGTFSQARNNNGMIRANGTVLSNVVDSTSTVDASVGVVGSVVVDGDSADKAVSGGTFAHNHVKPISALVTSELAGLSNNAIKSPGNDGDVIRSINKFETNEDSLFTTAVRANKYNRVTGAWDNGYPSGVTIAFSGDNAASPTASVPGELTYMTGAKTPLNDDYAKKTNY
jgi:hypothetical protein